MQDLIEIIGQFAKRDASVIAQKAWRTTLLNISATLLAFFAFLLGTSAALIYLSERFGGLSAVLLVGALFIVVALILFLIARSRTIVEQQQPPNSLDAIAGAVQSSLPGLAKDNEPLILLALGCLTYMTTKSKRR